MSAACENVYGAPAEDLVGACGGARQFSPLVPGANRLEDVAPGALNGFAMFAPPGTTERRRALALAIRALAPGASLIVHAPKDKGGSRLGADLDRLGCAFQETSKRHNRICTAQGPGDATAIAAAIADGEPRFLDAAGLWSQPGVFSWDRIDPGSALLLQHLAPLNGRGADFGCGLGVLARAVLASRKVASLTLVDIDRRALDMARLNIDDPRATFVWADARTLDLAGLDFVVMNPPFHDGGAEDKALGQTFIRRAAGALRNGGTLWLTANRHLPYEEVLKPLFRSVTPVAAEKGYKIYQAQK
ncbi:MAG: class I SAM-dependent methyltransferase [Rhodoblastus sp.]